MKIINLYNFDVVFNIVNIFLKVDIINEKLYCRFLIKCEEIIFV